MGLGEALGIKQLKLELNGSYTIEELYEKIKDVPFDAGTPALVKHGFTWLIAFPQQDRNNQVQIIPATKGKFVVQRSTQPAGVGNMLKNDVLNSLTDGLTSMSAAFGNKKKLCMELTEKTAATINALGI